MKLKHGEVTIAYEVRGTSGPWIIFSHSLGCTRHMWRRQIDELERTCRVLAYDLRGHGDSEADLVPGTLEQLAGDVQALMDHLDITSAHFVGISIGGMIGQTLAIESPASIASLVLANTGMYMPPAAVEQWMQRIQVAQDKGVDWLARPSMDRWFPESFRQAHPELIEKLVEEFSRTSVQGYVNCCQAIMGLDTRDALSRIQCPTLIIGGSDDPGASSQVMSQMSDRIRGSEILILDGAGHLSSIDHPVEFTAALKRFLLSNF